MTQGAQKWDIKHTDQVVRNEFLSWCWIKWVFPSFLYLSPVLFHLALIFPRPSLYPYLSSCPILLLILHLPPRLSIFVSWSWCFPLVLVLSSDTHSEHLTYTSPQPNHVFKSHFLVHYFFLSSLPFPSWLIDNLSNVLFPFAPQTQPVAYPWRYVLWQPRSPLVEVNAG